MYSFVVSDDKTRQVCQMFFLRTLGFKSNKILLTAMKKSKDGLLPSRDQRGKTVPTNKFSEEKRRDINTRVGGNVILTQKIYHEPFLFFGLGTMTALHCDEF